MYTISYSTKKFRQKCLEICQNCQGKTPRTKMSRKNVLKNCHKKMSRKIVTKKMSRKIVTKKCLEKLSQKNV